VNFLSVQQSLGRMAIATQAAAVMSAKSAYRIGVSAPLDPLPNII
jgi:hypothetical protein